MDIRGRETKDMGNTGLTIIWYITIAILKMVQNWIKNTIYGIFYSDVTNCFTINSPQVRVQNMSSRKKPVHQSRRSVSTAAEVSVLVIIPTGTQLLWESGMTPGQSSKETSCLLVLAKTKHSPEGGSTRWNLLWRDMRRDTDTIPNSRQSMQLC